MNRLSAAPAPPANRSGVAARVQRPWAAPSVEAATSLVAPQHYEPKYAYPLLVWLHSAGTSEREVRQIMPLVSLRNYVALGVRGPVASGSGFTWQQTAGAIHASELRVLDAVEAARNRFNIHRQRIYLAGYEAAGTMALRLALRHPDCFAGAASFNGPFPDSFAPLARLADLRPLKLMIAHCRDSRQYSVDRLCAELSLLHSASLSLHLRQYPCADELTTQMLHDLNNWLMEQVTGSAVNLPDATSLHGNDAR
jgi:phospholipase/carboxylesterase